MREKMNSGALAALLSSLISQLFVLVLLLFPSSNSTNTLSLLSSFSAPHQFIFPLLTHILSTTDISLLSFSKKRKRAHSPASDDDPTREHDGLAKFGSIIPKNPDSFKQFFRMNSSTFEWLCGLLEPLLECRDPVQSPLNLPAETRLGIGLFRLASGSNYREISHRFHVSELISKFCVKQLCRVLCTNYRFWVGFPSPNELWSVSSQFESLSGLPNCCGVIDCARFKIKTENGSNSILKDTSFQKEDTIAAQIVVDASSRILSVTAGFRGNKNDFMVLKSSTLYKDIEKGILLNSRNSFIDNVAVPQYFIGDGGYPLLPWLLIPFLDPSKGSTEENFNNVIRILRLPMLKAIASLRGWGVLSRPMDAEFKAAVANIGTCSILHNMLLTREDYSAFCDEVNYSMVRDRSSDYTLEEDLNENGTSIRSALAKTARRV